MENFKETKTNTKIGSYERNKRKVELKRINKGIWKK